MPAVLTAQHQRVNWGHPLAQGLLNLWIPRSGILTDVASGAPTTVGAGTVATVVGRQGPAIAATTARQGWAVPANSFYTTNDWMSTGATMFFSGSCIEAGGTGGVVINVRASTPIISLSFNNVTTAFFRTRVNAGGLVDITSAALGSRVHGVVVGVLTPGGAMAIYRNGVRDATSTNPGVLSGCTHLDTLGDMFGSGTTTSCQFTMTGLWKRGLSGSEVAALSMDPFQMLETPSTRRTYILSPQGAPAGQPFALRTSQLAHVRLGSGGPIRLGGG